MLVKNVIPKHMESLTAKLMEMNVKIEEFDESIRIYVKDRLTKVNIKTLPYPGFPTDLQPPAAILLLRADGISTITEGIFENRFQYIEELKRMGANIRVEGRMAVIEGGSKLTGAPIKATDLRAGAACVIAGLIAEEETEISNVHYIDRGYENMVEKLRRLGADIKRISGSPVKSEPRLEKLKHLKEASSPCDHIRQYAQNAGQGHKHDKDLQPFSGSSGNCIFVSYNETAILIDAGVSGRRTEIALEGIGESFEKIAGIFITHEHSDHISGAGILSRRYKIPIYANTATWTAMRPFMGKLNSEHIRHIEVGEIKTIGDISVRSFPIPHEQVVPSLRFYCREKTDHSQILDIWMICFWLILRKI